MSDIARLIIFKILVPVYKTEKYLDECIRSVLSQTYKNFELIIVDDGSPDNCGDICDRYARADNRIKVIHQKNMGLLAARRTAIGYILNNRYKENDFVIFLDSDDYLKKNALERINEEVQDKRCDMVVYGMDLVCGGKVVVPFKGNENGVISDKTTLYKKVFCDNSYNPLCRKAISIKLLADDDYTEYYHISNAEDLLQSIPLYKRCGKVSIINDSLYNYTINPNSISRSITFETYHNDFTVREKVLDFLERENVFGEKDFREYRAYCVRLIAENIIKIMRFDAKEGEKVKLLEAIAQSDYYCRYIKDKPYSKNMINKKLLVIYSLFTKKLYHIIKIIVGLNDTFEKRKIGRSSR